MKSKNYANNYDAAISIVHFFILKYEEKFKRAHSVNVVKAKFQIKDLLSFYSEDFMLKIIEYYIQIEDHPIIDDLVINFQDYIELKETVEQDRLRRSRVRKNTEKLVNEYREQK